jgi:hypothetical protein
MITWSYTSGHIQAHSAAQALLCTIPATAMWAPLADILNANQQLSQLLLAGYGYCEAET